MVTVSDSFKQSVSSTEREMKGYVEVTYTSSEAKTNTAVSNYPNILKIGSDWLDPSGIIDNDRIGKNYASLEQDYFLLDGTFVLPNNEADENPGVGYISADTFEDDDEIPITPFQISTNWGETKPVNGLTLYFKNNKPLNIEIQVTSGVSVETFTTNDVEIKDNGTVMLIFSERTVDIVKVYVKDVLYTNRRIRLQEIDFGLSAIYEGTDLVRFKTIEQCNRFCDEIPINECEVVLGDYQDDFDTINPKGITEYLTKDVIIKPYAGVVTEDYGIEYCPQGWYWLDSWKKSEDDVTLNCKGYLSKFQTDFYLEGSTLEDINYYLHNKLGLNIYFWYNNNVTPPNNNMPYINGAYKLSTGIQAFQKYFSLYGNSLVEAKNQLDEEFAELGNYDYIFKALYYDKDGIIKDTINKDVLQKYQEITLKPQIKQMQINEYNITSFEPSTAVLYENTIECNGEETIAFDYGKNYLTNTYIICDDYSNLQIIDAMDHIFDNNDNVIYSPHHHGNRTYNYTKLIYNGNLTYKVIAVDEVVEKTTQYVENYTEDGQKLEYSNEKIGSREMSTFWANFRKLNENKYSTKFTYNGNPALELGDNIKVESKFKDDNDNKQYDLVWITKIESEFDGSFEQTIEGDILE